VRVQEPGLIQVRRSRASRRSSRAGFVLLLTAGVFGGCAPSGDGGSPETAERGRAQEPDTARGPEAFDRPRGTARVDTPDGSPVTSTDDVPPDTTGTVLPDAEEIVPEEIPPAAYEACKQAAAAKLAPPQGAIWGEAPDTVERTPEGDFALVAQVRPDTLRPGISYACVVRSEGGSWRVVTLEAQPAAP
jgi:hypothetical protein